MMPGWCQVPNGWLRYSLDTALIAACPGAAAAAAAAAALQLPGLKKLTDDDVWLKRKAPTTLVLHARGGNCLGKQLITWLMQNVV
jgi:hypothetical protein